MTINFDKYAQTGKEFVNRVAFELGDESDTERAGRLLRGTLHALRHQSSPEEAMQFMSQLPMFIKALYVDGWNLGSHKHHVRHLGDFIDEVYSQNGLSDDITSESDQRKLEDIQAVIRVLEEYVSHGEVTDFRHTLPKELKVLFDR
jgi:uncharacterized protein (DUF2267 family)